MGNMALDHAPGSASGASFLHRSHCGIRKAKKATSTNAHNIFVQSIFTPKKSPAIAGLSHSQLFISPQT